MDIKAVRARLRAERLERRWSLDDLAEKAGVNRSAIHDIETNLGGKPRLETIAKLAEGLGLTLSDFFARIEGSTAQPVVSTNDPSLTEPRMDHAGSSSSSSVRRPLDDIGALLARNTAALDELIEAVKGIGGELRAAREQAAGAGTAASARPARRRRAG